MSFEFSRSYAPNLALSFLTAMIALALVIASEHLSSAIDRKRENAEITIATLKSAEELDSELSTGWRANFYLHGSAQESLSQFQRDAIELAESKDFKIDVITPRESVKSGALIQLDLEISGTLNEADLGGLLEALTTTSPPMLVREMTVRQVGRGRRQPNNRSISLSLALKAFSMEAE